MSSFHDPKNTEKARPQAALAPAEQEAAIPVDGFGQVISLLQVADAAFRESLLGRIAAKDPVLARDIRAALARS